MERMFSLRGVFGRRSYGTDGNGGSSRIVTVAWDNIYDCEVFRECKKQVRDVLIEINMISL